MDDDLAEALRRKSSFLEQRRRSLGPEYYSNKHFWDRMWEQEWHNLEEVKELSQEEVLETIPINHPTVEFEGNSYTIYTYSDFTMLHNQGIFRETIFILDHTGKWRKNVINELESYGFQLVKNYKKGMLLLEVRA